MIMAVSDPFDRKRKEPRQDRDLPASHGFPDEESKKAAEKAMALLLHKDRTRQELKDRLYRSGFSERASQKALEYVEQYGYINDKRYAERYVMFQKNKKSKKELEYQLTGRGVSREIVSEVLREEEYDGEEDAVRSLILKRMKGRKFCELSNEERQKIIMYLGRKGYDLHVVKKVYSQLDNYDEKV